MSQFENDITIEQIVDSFSAKLENGEQPSIEEYKLRYPHFADRIEAILPALVVLDNVDSQPRPKKLAIDDSIPELLGNYQIVQEIGRGGMGIVFEAIHSSLRRRVALKVLPKSSAENPKYLKRFQMEAQSAGQLHHTNIVPVFEVGHENDLHFYAMQFIHGENLDRVIEDIKILRNKSTGSSRNLNASAGLSRSLAKTMIRTELELTSALATPNSENSDDADASDVSESNSVRYELPVPSKTSITGIPKTSLSDSGFGNSNGSSSIESRSVFHRRVAAVGVQVAQALHHAHSHNILHRDVKPANLILDTDGNVWVTDFGLAKFETTELTQTGDIVGTLRYMAPERFAGNADARSDIYSLGLTLYELCTLKCAFENDRGTLVQDVANSSSVIKPRKIDQTIPPDLETIILKSIEPQAQRRYQTALDMAKDLELFLADRPIRARRATLAEKFWRICRRNPLVSSLAACLVLALMIVTMGSIQFARNEIKNRKESQKSLYLSKLDQAKMRRFSGRPGQRFKTMDAIRSAIGLLPEMEFSKDQVREARFNLRSEVVAAMSLTDIDLAWQAEFRAGWGERKRWAIDPSGQYFAVGNNFGPIQIRNISDNRMVREFPGRRGKDPPWAMRFCPNGKYLIARYHQPNVHDEFLTIVWNVETGQQAYETRHTVDFSFSHDSRFIGITYSDRAEIVRLEDGELAHAVIPDFSTFGTSHRIRFNSTATAVAISEATKGIVEFWNIERHPYLMQTVTTKNNVFRMAWDSDRQIFVVGSSRGDLYYWIGSLEEEPASIRLHQNTIHALHLHPDIELVATTAWDGTTRFTDLVAGKEILAVEDHELLSNGFCRKGRLGMVLPNDQLGLMDVVLPMTQAYSSPGQQGNGFACCAHPIHNNVVARTIGEDIEFWDIERRNLLRRINTGLTRQVEFSNSGKYFFTCGDNGLQRFDVSCDGIDLQLDNPKTLIDESTTGIYLSKYSDSILVGIDQLDAARLINPYTGAVLQYFGTHRNLGRLCLIAKDRFALTGTWHGLGIKVWDVETGNLVQTIHDGLTSTTPLAYPADDNIFYSDRREIAEFAIDANWSFDQAGEVNPVSLTREFEADAKIEFSHRGDIMSYQTHSYYVDLMDVKSGRKLVRIVTAGQSRIVDTRFSLDDSSLILACYDSLQVVDLAGLREELSTLGLDW